MSVYSRSNVLETSDLLTNEVWLSALDVQNDEADHACQCRDDTKREGEVDGGFVLLPHSWQEEER
jgi:hypothetical protein